MNYFTEKELSCPCCGVNKFDPEALKKFNALRHEHGKPIKMNSGYRCEAYNTKKGYTQTHATGQAGDLSSTHKDAYNILRLAPKHGFTGIGVKQKGGGRFIHLDTLAEDVGRPRPHIWSY